MTTPAPAEPLDAARRELDAARRELDALRRELEITYQERDAARRDAITDPLTGIPNRRGGELLLDRAAETGALLLLGMVDVDDLKTVNDTRGHPAGDELLSVVAEVLSAVTADVAGPLPEPAAGAARLSGDEFLLVLPGAADPEQIADRIHTALAGYSATHSDRHRPSISIGWTTTHQTSPAKAVIAADDALTAAKHSTPQDGHTVRSVHYRSGSLPREAATAATPPQRNPNTRTPRTAVGSSSRA